MGAFNEFWLALRELAEAYDSQGLTTEERTAHIVEQFRNVAPAARQQLLADLFQLTSELPDIYAHTAAVERAADAVNWRRRNGTAKLLSSPLSLSPLSFPGSRLGTPYPEAPASPLPASLRASFPPNYSCPIRTIRLIRGVFLPPCLCASV